MSLTNVEEKLKEIKGRRKETTYGVIHSFYGQILDTGFVDRFHVRCDRRIKDDIRVSILSNYKNWVVIYRNGEGWGPWNFWLD